MEVGLVFDRCGYSIFWHLPPNASDASLPDSRELWDILWTHRDNLGGVAHTHPWSGRASPSPTDVTTYAAVEAGLGRRLYWPIVTFSEVGYFEWVGPDRLDYGVQKQRRFRLRRDDIENLRRESC